MIQSHKHVPKLPHPMRIEDKTATLQEPQLKSAKAITPSFSPFRSCLWTNNAAIGELTVFLVSVFPVIFLLVHLFIIN